MKKKIYILVLLFCILGIEGCAKKGVEEIVINAYESWKITNMNIWIIGLSLDTGESYFFDEDKEIPYYKVKDERLQNLDDIKGAIEEVCTKKCAERMYYTPYLENDSIYLENNGILYRKMVEIPANYGGELRGFQIKEQKKDYIHAELEYYEDLVGEYYTIDITIVLQGDKWMIDSVEQLWLS